MYGCNLEVTGLNIHCKPKYQDISPYLCSIVKDRAIAKTFNQRTFYVELWICFMRNYFTIEVNDALKRKEIKTIET